MIDSPACTAGHARSPRYARWLLQAVHKQADGEPLVDVVTEEGQELAGLPAGDCCLQVSGRCRRMALCPSWQTTRHPSSLVAAEHVAARSHPPAALLPAALLPGPCPPSPSLHSLLYRLGRHPMPLMLQNERDDTVDDLVKSDFLHEPG